MDDYLFELEGGNALIKNKMKLIKLLKFKNKMYGCIAMESYYKSIFTLNNNYNILYYIGFFNGEIWDKRIKINENIYIVKNFCRIKKYYKKDNYTYYNLNNMKIKSANNIEYYLNELNIIIKIIYNYFGVIKFDYKMDKIFLLKNKIKKNKTIYIYNNKLFIFDK